MIRPTQPADIAALLSLTAKTGVFKPHEVEALNEVLEDYFATNQSEGHVCVTHVSHEHIDGFAYYAPAAMTDRTWYLYWIAVVKGIQGKGLGSKLLKHAEDDIRGQNGRVLFIETSSLPHYEQTRKFYLKHHYEITGQLKDYYTDGDDMVVFRNALLVQDYRFQSTYSRNTVRLRAE